MRPTISLKTVNGTEKLVGWCDALWCRLTNTRVRFSKVVGDGAGVEVMDDDGKVIGLRLTSQVWAV